MNTKLKFRSQPSKKLNNKKFLKKLSFINAQACKLIQEHKYKESIDLLNAQKSNLDLNPNPNTKIIYKSRYLPRLSLRHSQSKLFGNGS